jgi:hypothetical protein
MVKICMGAGGAFGEKLLDRTGDPGTELRIALRDRRRGSSGRGSRARPQLVRGKLRNDGNRSGSGFHFERLAALKTRTPQGGRGDNNNGSFVFEGNRRRFVNEGLPGVVGLSTISPTRSQSTVTAADNLLEVGVETRRFAALRWPRLRTGAFPF